MRKIFLFLLVVISLVSCNKDAGDISSFMLTGDATQQMSDANIQHFKNRQAKCEDKLHIQINNVCQQKEYLHQINQLNGVINICVYNNPRIIKADTYGLGSIILHGEYLNQYFKIQQDYAHGQSIEKSIDEMMNLCLQANAYAKTQKGFFKRMAHNPVSEIFGEAYDFVANIFVPKDNFFGKIASPFYRIACWSINKTQSLTNGLNMLFLLMFCTCLLTLCIHIIFIKKTRKNLIGIDIIRLILEWTFFLSIIFYTVFLSTPSQEILYALDIYNINTKNIELAFNNYTFKTTSLFIIIMTSISWLALSLFNASNRYKQLEKSGMSQLELQHEVEEMGDNLGDKIGTRALAVIFFLFLDRSILLGLFMFFTLRLIAIAIMKLKPITLFLFNHGLKVAGVILFICFCGYQGLSNNNGSSDKSSSSKTNNNNIKTKNTAVAYNPNFTYAHLDSINHLIAKDMYQMTKGMPRSKWKNLIIDQMQRGWNDYYKSQYTISKEFTTKLNQTINVSGQITSFDDKSALAGVVVNIKGAKKGTVTDNNGKYSIYAKPNDTLECMLLGYNTRYIPVKGNSSINISMNKAAFFEDILAFPKFDTQFYNEYVKNGNFKNGVSYMIGAQLAKKHYHNGITDGVNLQDIYNVATTLHKKKNYKYSDAVEKNLIKHHQSINYPIIYQRNQNFAQLFLKENEKRSNVIKTKSGLQLYIINKGKGKKPHALKSNVTIKYTGYKLNGEVFDKSNEPIKFKCSGVISGLSEALTYIAPGGKLIAYIPSNLAYGDKKAGNIFPGEMLIFEVELISVK